MRLLVVFLLILFSASIRADDRVAQYLEVMESSLNTTTLFYKRLSPEIAKQIKTVELPSEAGEVAKCVVDAAKKDNKTALFDESIKLNKEFRDYIINTPDLTLLTLEQDQEFVKIQNEMTSSKYEPFIKYTKDCGALDMNMKLTRSSGIFEAMKLMRELGD